MDKKPTKSAAVKRIGPKQSPRIRDSKSRVAHKKGGGSLDPGPNKPKR